MNSKDLFGFDGKTVVVSGASSGMGEAAAALLTELGAKVYAIANKKKIQVPVEKRYNTDLGDKRNIDALIAELPQHIDALFLCQGMAQTSDNHLLVQKVNFLSVMYMAEALLGRIPDRGSVTLISSNGGFNWQKDFKICREVIDIGDYDGIVAWYEANPDKLTDAYCFSKRCMDFYTVYRAHDPLYIGRKIRLNCINPGTTITGLTDEFNRFTSGTDDAEEGRRILEKLFHESWDGHWASAAEMGYPMVAIGSNLFSYMTGEIISLDYGLSAKWTMEELNGVTNHFGGGVG
ncbi:MAG: SDR family oxidoreductase [Clostridiales Family XIII bacterium]|jgi:NAD(P)-dependent dehydrogenase (short-subunit alcohol dehydrogenase family)|nr:SDR family oxidoreductase [Clostridiales Family XIII bacterium]